MNIYKIPRRNPYHNIIVPTKLIDGIINELKAFYHKMKASSLLFHMKLLVEKEKNVSDRHVLILPR
jgi:hypothetical protein